MEDQALAQVVNIASFGPKTFFSLKFSDGIVPSREIRYTNRKGVVLRISGIVTNITRSSKVKVLGEAHRIFDCELKVVSGNLDQIKVGSKLWQGELGVI